MSAFREPTRELPMPNEIRLGARRDWLGLRGSVWTVDEAEALLEVLLDICPNTQDIVDDWLAREGLIIVERPDSTP